MPNPNETGTACHLLPVSILTSLGSLVTANFRPVLDLLPYEAGAIG
jgi:hypothetical protein